MPITSTTISRLITYVKEQDDEGNHIGFLGTVTDDDDDDTTTRSRGVNDDDEVIPFPPQLNVIALDFTNAARARIERAGGRCLNFYQLPLTMKKYFLFTLANHNDIMVIFKYNNNITSGSQTMRNVRRRIQEGERDYYYCIPKATRAVMDNDDLLSEILIRLPAKTLGGLKVINKRWYSFISHPSFVTKHTSLQTTRDATSFLLQTCTFLSKFFGDNISLLSFNHPSRNLLSETIFSLDIPPGNYGMSSICASCRGLLLVVIGGYIYIYNPLTKKKEHIPSPSKMFRCGYGIIFGGSTSSNQYDYNNHYTVVCLVEAHKAFKFKIFMPKKRRWRDSNKSSMISYDTNGLEIGYVCEHVLPVCYRGIIHWLTEDGYIIAFNLDKEESKLIEIPKSVIMVGVTTDWWNCAWFGLLDDEIILVVAAFKHEIVTWVLHDYENNKWKIKRKDVIKPGRIPIVYIRPLFFDGQRFFLTISTNIDYTGCKLHLWMEHDISTGVSKPLRSEGPSSLFIRPLRFVVSLFVEDRYTFCLV